MERKVYNDPININKKEWLEILDDDITYQNVLDILRFLLEKHEERTGIIAEKFGYSHLIAVNKIIAAYGDRIITKYPKVKCPKYENGKPAWFHVSLLAEKKDGFWYFKLRPELAEALKVYKTE